MTQSSRVGDPLPAEVKATKAEFCKSLEWNPTAVSLALGKIEWFDLTGMMELPNKNVAKIELGTRGTVGQFEGFDVTIINPRKAKVDQKYFRFDDYLTKRKDNRPDYKNGFQVIAHCGWHWYIAEPVSTLLFEGLNHETL